VAGTRTRPLAGPGAAAGTGRGRALSPDPATAGTAAGSTAGTAGTSGTADGSTAGRPRRHTCPVTIISSFSAWGVIRHQADGSLT
jgi:hypothetical protein